MSARTASALLPDGLCGPRWLAPLRGAVPELTHRDWTHFAEFEATLRDLLGHPAQGRRTDGDAGSSSVALLAVRRLLAPMVARHDTTDDHLDDHHPEHPTYTGAASAVGRADLRQTLRQVICGYYDLDQRDATGPGHGRMILRHAVPATRARWAARLRAGDLAGIAMTEQIGGTQVHAITTALVPALAGDWQLIGEKCWISRLAEASVFVVFARVDRDRIAAVVVDAAAPGIHRDREQPTGLRGWSWGRLTFDGVPVTAADVLSSPDLDGLVVFAEHFAHYRPLVTATALGAAAAAHDTVTAHLTDRQHRGEIGRVRDHALITIGRAHAQINSGLLAVLHTQRLAAADDPAASLWARTTKALGVDLAREATDELSVLMGATGFTAEHRLQKTRLALSVRTDRSCLRVLTARDRCARDRCRRELTAGAPAGRLPRWPPWWPPLVAGQRRSSSPGGCGRSTLTHSSSTAERPGRRKGGVRSELADMTPCEIRGAVDADEHLRSELTDRTSSSRARRLRRGCSGEGGGPHAVQGPSVGQQQFPPLGPAALGVVEARVALARPGDPHRAVVLGERSVVAGHRQRQVVEAQQLRGPPVAGGHHARRPWRAVPGVARPAAAAAPRALRTRSSVHRHVWPSRSKRAAAAQGRPLTRITAATSPAVALGWVTRTRSTCDDVRGRTPATMLRR
jgi:hypothetical protein